jgi:hypothetical protein
MPTVVTIQATPKPPTVVHFEYLKVGDYFHTLSSPEPESLCQKVELVNAYGEYDDSVRSKIGRVYVYSGRLCTTSSGVECILVPGVEIAY